MACRISAPDALNGVAEVEELRIWETALPIGRLSQIENKKTRTKLA
jgi:hypothetical protein